MSAELTADERESARNIASQLKQGHWQAWCEVDREIRAIAKPEKERAAARLQRLILELLPEDVQMKLLTGGWQMGEVDQGRTTSSLPLKET